MKALIAALVVIVLILSVALTYVVIVKGERTPVVVASQQTGSDNHENLPMVEREQPVRTITSTAERKDFDGKGVWQGLEIYLGMSIDEVKRKWRGRSMDFEGLEYYVCEEQGVSFGATPEEHCVVLIAFRDGWKVFGVKVGDSISSARSVLGAPKYERWNMPDDCYQLVYSIAPGALEVRSASERGRIDACIWSMHPPE